MATEINTAVLSQAWLHSHEEDTDSEMVFRPAGYNFPPSRGRTGFDLQSGGKLKRTGVGADDRKTQSAGNWKVQNNDLIFYSGTSLAADRSQQIVTLDSDKLVLKK